MPPRAETMAMVGMGPECCSSSSPPSTLLLLLRPELSRTSKSPTVRYKSASAKDAPPNLCTSHGFGELFGDVTLAGQISEVGILLLLLLVLEVVVVVEPMDTPRGSRRGVVEEDRRREKPPPPPAPPPPQDVVVGSSRIEEGTNADAHTKDEAATTAAAMKNGRWMLRM